VRDHFGNDSSDYDGPASDEDFDDRRFAETPTRAELADAPGSWGARQWREAVTSPRCIAGRAANGWGPKLTLDDLAVLRIDDVDLEAWGLSRADVIADTNTDSTSAATSAATDPFSRVCARTLTAAAA